MWKLFSLDYLQYPFFSIDIGSLLVWNFIFFQVQNLNYVFAKKIVFEKHADWCNKLGWIFVACLISIFILHNSTPQIWNLCQQDDDETCCPYPHVCKISLQAKTSLSLQFNYIVILCCLCKVQRKILKICNYGALYTVATKCSGITYHPLV